MALRWMVVLLVLAGCSEAPRSGDRASPAPGASTDASWLETGPALATIEPVVARDFVGNAFVAAARVHKHVVQGEYHAARGAVLDMRRQLRLATERASLEQQRVINRLDGHAIEVEAMIERQSPEAVQASNMLMQTFFAYYDMLALEATGATAPVAPEMVEPASGTVEASQ